MNASHLVYSRCDFSAFSAGTRSYHTREKYTRDLNDSIHIHSPASGLFTQVRNQKTSTLYKNSSKIQLKITAVHGSLLQANPLTDFENIRVDVLSTPAILPTRSPAIVFLSPIVPHSCYTPSFFSFRNVSNTTLTGCN
jgi:hypothetical protein